MNNTQKQIDYINDMLNYMGIEADANKMTVSFVKYMNNCYNSSSETDLFDFKNFLNQDLNITEEDREYMLSVVLNSEAFTVNVIKSKTRGKDITRITSNNPAFKK